MTLEHALQTYWASLESPHSRRGYVHDWEVYVEWLVSEGVAVLEAKPSDVQRYVNKLRDKGKSKPTRARALSVIRSVYDYLTVNNFVPHNPARSVKNPKVDSTPKTPWLEEDGAARLLARAGEDWRSRRDRMCLLLFLGIGWRRSEITRMNVEDFRDGTVTGTVKGGKLATVGVPNWLQREIEDWCTFANIESGPLLPKTSGSKIGISNNTVYDIVKAAAKRAGLDVAPHGLRRTFITILRKRGVDLKDLQTAVAHASSHTTERYDKAKGVNAPGEILADLVYGKTDE